jgi:hypothetical protein
MDGVEVARWMGMGMVYLVWLGRLGCGRVQEVRIEALTTGSIGACQVC